MFVDGGVARVPFHNPVVSGAFVGESNVIPVGALLLSSFTLKPKKVGSILTASREFMQGAAVERRDHVANAARQRTCQVDGRQRPARHRRPRPRRRLQACSMASRRSHPRTGSGLYCTDGRREEADRRHLARNPTGADHEQRAVCSLCVARTECGTPRSLHPYLAANTIVALDAASFASSLGVPEFQTDEDAAIHEETVPLPIIGGIVQPPVIGSIAAPTRSLWQTASLGIRTLID